MMFTAKWLGEQLSSLTASQHFMIAYSGGLDSHVLLHALASLRQEYPQIMLRAVHVHHGLNEMADVWQAHCQRACEQLQVPFSCYRLQINKQNGESLEAIARQARYQLLAEKLQTNECLLTAHHQNDQAETLLLQLLRGAGPSGLAAMPVSKAFAHTVHLRPLLDISRAQLEDYAQQNQLHWIEDDSNQDLRFDRNFLRQIIMPKLHARWPKLFATLSRAACHQAESQHLLAELARQDFATIANSDQGISVSQLRQLSPERQRNVLRFWFSQNHILLPHAKKLKQIQREFLTARIDANPEIQWDDNLLYRFRDQLYLTKKSHDFVYDQQQITWDLKQPLILPIDLGRLMVHKIRGQGISDSISTDQLTIRFRQGGEKIKPAGNKSTRPLKKLFQEWAVPPRMRGQIPLLFYQEQLIAVIGYCVSADVMASADELGWVIEWARPPAPFEAGMTAGELAIT